MNRFNCCSLCCQPCHKPHFDKCCEHCHESKCDNYYPDCFRESKRGCSHFSIINNPPPVVLTSIQAQLQDNSEGAILDGANIIFDTVLLNTSSEITYDDTTGIFTLNAPGRYLVNWWVNVDGASQSTSVIFSAESGATSISASSPTGLTTLELYGQGLFDVGSVPATLSLVNNTGDTVILATSLVQADIVIQKL
ncbi:MAG: hypothetical protein EOM55_00275 [Clostridia bacterium]|nr:hypothetical protein [Clostridia bacterium]